MVVEWPDGGAILIDYWNGLANYSNTELEAGDKIGTTALQVKQTASKLKDWG
jgi:hypothetical protein